MCLIGLDGELSMPFHWLCSLLTPLDRGQVGGKLIHFSASVIFIVKVCKKNHQDIKKKKSWASIQEVIIELCGVNPEGLCWDQCKRSIDLYLRNNSAKNKQTKIHTHTLDCCPAKMCLGSEVSHKLLIIKF